MKVRLIAPSLAVETIRQHVSAQLRLFRQRGDEVQLVIQDPSTAAAKATADLGDVATGTAEPLPSSGLCIYHYAGDYSLLSGLRKREQGAVLVHDHGTAPPDWLPIHYADLCLVEDDKRRDELVNEFGLSPERVRLLPKPGQESAYRTALTEVIEQVLGDDWELPAEGTVGSPSQPAKPSRAGQTTQRGRLNLARNQADVMLRDYVVRSRIPLLGGLVAWVRNTLTSHLREPYLDPTLERQVAFNQTIVTWMEGVQTQLEVLEAEVQLLQDQSPSTAQGELQGAEPEKETPQPTSNRRVSDAG